MFLGGRMTLCFKTDEEILEEISNSLLAKRKALGLSQRELAAKAGVSFRTVQTLERGGNPTIMNFIAIVRALGELRPLRELAGEGKTARKSLSPKQMYKKAKAEL